jgi:hypothetical protein
LKLSILACKAACFQTAGGECALEREAYDWLVSELTEQYELEGLADEILAGRVAMYLIRIARAEAYESAVGVTEKLILWGKYIRGLDNTLRGIMRDLAVTREKRKRFEKGEELLVDLDDLLEKFVEKSERKSGELARVEKRRITSAPVMALLRDWRDECRRLRLTIRRVERVEEEKEDS